MRHQLIALAASASVTLGAQTVHGGGSASQDRPLPRAAGAPPTHQTPMPPRTPTAPQTPLPSPVPPPVILPFPPLMTPPTGGLTPGVVWVPPDPTRPPRDAFRARRFPPIGSPFYSPFVAGYGYGGIAGAGETTPSTPVQPAAGMLRLSVTPTSAQVFVDSYYVGTVEDIEAQRVLTLATGPHRIEIRAQEYQTITFDIRIMPYETVTYRGALERIRPAVAVAPVSPVSRNPMYVIPNCYMGNMPPRPGRLPSGCDIKQVQILARQ